MYLMSFIFGLAVGIVFFLWRKNSLNQQLKRIFNLLSDDINDLPSLPLLSLVRREVFGIRQKIQKLEEDLEIYQQLIEIAPVGYLLVDQEDQLIWSNEQAKNLLVIDEYRWQPGQIRLFLEVVRSYELDRLIEKTRQSKTSQTVEWEFFPYKNQGENSYIKLKSSIYLKASTLLLPNGNIAIFLENKQSLIELSEYRDRAFSDLTHELKTPLTAIRLVAETLEKRLQKPELTWVQQMLKDTNRLINLVQNWLEITQMKENPHQHLEYQRLELKEIIFSVWQSLQPLAQKKNISLNYKNIDNIYLQGDRPRLTQVFLNILDNSIKHSPYHGIIQIDLETSVHSEQKSTVEINIIDSGCGFIKSDLPLVFKRLYRGDQARTRESSDRDNDGHGLGLAIVAEIIAAHQGKVEAKNHPKTGGAWLKITLPINCHI